MSRSIVESYRGMDSAKPLEEKPKAQLSGELLKDVTEFVNNVESKVEYALQGVEEEVKALKSVLEGIDDFKQELQLFDQDIAARQGRVWSKDIKTNDQREREARRAHKQFMKGV